MRKSIVMNNEYYPREISNRGHYYPNLQYNFNPVNPNSLHPSNLPNPPTKLNRNYSYSTTGGPDLTKQNSIILNMRQQLGNLKTEVAKLMSKDDNGTHTNLRQINSKPSTTSYRQENKRQNRSPLNFKQPTFRAESIPHDSTNLPHSGLGKVSDTSSKFEHKDNDVEKVLSQNRKLQRQLRQALTRQRQLRDEKRRLSQTFERQKLKLQQELQNRSLMYLTQYSQQTQQSQKNQLQFEKELSKKDIKIESQKKRIHQLSTQYENKISHFSTHIKQMEKSLALKDHIVKSLNEQLQIQKTAIQLQKNKGVKKEVSRQQQSKRLDLLIIQKDATISQKNQTISMLMQQINSMNTRTREYLDQKETNQKITLEEQDQACLKQKQAIVLQKEHQIISLAKKNSQLQKQILQIKQIKQKLQNVKTPQKNHSQEDNQRKTELKQKQKQINTLINDIKHLQHDLRQANNSKILLKSLNDLIDQLNQSIIQTGLSSLSQQYKDFIEQN